MLVAPSGPDSYAGAPVHRVRSDGDADVPGVPGRTRHAGSPASADDRLRARRRAPGLAGVAGPPGGGGRPQPGHPGRRGLPDRPDRLRRALPVPRRRRCDAQPHPEGARAGGPHPRPEHREREPARRAGHRTHPPVGTRRGHAAVHPAPPGRAGPQGAGRGRPRGVRRTPRRREGARAARPTCATSPAPGWCWSVAGPRSSGCAPCSRRRRCSAYGTGRTSPRWWPPSTSSCTPGAPRRSASPPRRRSRRACRSWRPGRVVRSTW